MKLKYILWFFLPLAMVFNVYKFEILDNVPIPYMILLLLTGLNIFSFKLKIASHQLLFIFLELLLLLAFLVSSVFNNSPILQGRLAIFVVSLLLLNFAFIAESNKKLLLCAVSRGLLISLAFVLVLNILFYFNFIFLGNWNFSVPEMPFMSSIHDYRVSAGGGSFLRATLPFPRTHDLALFASLIYIYFDYSAIPQKFHINTPKKLTVFIKSSCIFLIFLSLSRSVIIPFAAYFVLKNWKSIFTFRLNRYFVLVVFPLSLLLISILLRGLLSKLLARFQDLQSTLGHLDIRIKYFDSIFDGNLFNFFFGYGNETWYLNYLDVVSRGSSHSTVLTLLGEGGLSMLIVSSSLFLVIISKKWRSMLPIILFYILVNLFYDFTSNSIQILFLLLFFVPQFSLQPDQH